MAKSKKKKSYAWIVILVIVIAGAALYAQFGLTFVWKQNGNAASIGGCDFDYQIRNNLSEDYCIRTEYYDFSNYDGSMESVKYATKRSFISEKVHEEIMNLYAQSEYVPEGFAGITDLEESDIDSYTLKLGIASNRKSVVDDKEAAGAVSPDGSSNIFATVCSPYGAVSVNGLKTELPLCADIPRGRVLAIIGFGTDGTEELQPSKLQLLEWRGNDEAVVEYLSANKAVIVVKLDKQGDKDKSSKVAKALKNRASKSTQWKMTGGKFYAGVVEDMYREARSEGRIDENGRLVEENESGLATGGEMNADMAAMLSAYAMTMTDAQAVESIDLPEKSTDISFELAKEALTLCTGHSKSGQAEMMLNSGFEIVLQKGYDKKNEDTSHTCAFTVGKKLVDYYGQARTLFVVAIRGTNAGEWVSNFDFARESMNGNVYAENFLQSGEAVYLNLIPLLTDYPDALILVCGHSRGAAAANMLGMTLDDVLGKDNVYVYTFATPTTYRGNDGITGYENIFNFINPADVVPHLPLEGWGYGRIGIDLVLPNEPESIERIESAMAEFAETSPTIRQYYQQKHSLIGADDENDNENSFTTYQIMLAMASSMTGIRYDENGGRNMADMYAIMDGSATGSESKYAGLFNRLDKVIGRDGSWGMDIFGQHMPMAYTALIDAYAQIFEQLPPMLTPKLLSGKNLMDLNEEEIMKMMMPPSTWDDPASSYFAGMAGDYVPGMGPNSEE